MKICEGCEECGIQFLLCINKKNLLIYSCYRFGPPFYWVICLNLWHEALITKWIWGYSRTFVSLQRDLYVYYAYTSKLSTSQPEPNTPFYIFIFWKWVALLGLHYTISLLYIFYTVNVSHYIALTLFTQQTLLLLSLYI